jgi:hypothetical protein
MAVRISPVADVKIATLRPPCDFAKERKNKPKARKESFPSAERSKEQRSLVKVLAPI